MWKKLTQPKLNRHVLRMVAYVKMIKYKQMNFKNTMTTMINVFVCQNHVFYLLAIDFLIYRYLLFNASFYFNNIYFLPLIVAMVCVILLFL